jgi:hypothetical protein
MNKPSRADVLIRQLYRLREELAEAHYQPDPEYESQLEERAENLCLEIEEAGGVVPDELI